MRPGFSLTEHVRTADPTKLPVHLISAIRDVRKIAQLALDGNRLSAEAGVHRPATSAKILAQATPTRPRGDWPSARSIANGSAQTLTCNHSSPSPYTKLPQHHHRPRRAVRIRVAQIPKTPKSTSSQPTTARAERYLNDSGRGSGMKPSRLGIRTRESVWASSTSALSMILPSARM